MEAINEKLRFEKYYKQPLAGNPTPLSGAIEPKCLFYNSVSSAPPEFSIVMPIYNQSKIIVRNLESITAHTKGSYEMILIIDSCSDDSEAKVCIWASKQTLNTDSFSALTVIKSETPLFECSADNIGFTLAQGRYLLEIQADMTMTEPGYNLLLRRPFEVLHNVIGVSGRCCHGIMNKTGIGRLGSSIEKQYDPSFSNKIFYVNETCNRGPLLLDTEKVKSLGYLDEANFYLDNSDHDLFTRAWVQNKWICGYVPIHFDSPIEEGSTRKPRDPLNSKFLTMRKARSNGGYLAVYVASNPEPRMPSMISLL
jgi:glycosyltransferase involved in cell wall biosynthesis